MNFTDEKLANWTKHRVIIFLHAWRSVHIFSHYVATLLQDGQTNQVVKKKDEKGTGSWKGRTAGNVEKFWRALLGHRFTVSSETMSWSWFVGNQVLEGRQTLQEEKKELIGLLRKTKPYQTKPKKNWLNFIFIRPTAAQDKEKYTNQDWALRKHN